MGNQGQGWHGLRILLGGIAFPLLLAGLPLLVNKDVRLKTLGATFVFVAGLIFLYLLVSSSMFRDFTNGIVKKIGDFYNRVKGIIAGVLIGWIFLLIVYTIIYLTVYFAPGSLSVEVIPSNVYTRGDSVEFAIMVKSHSWRSQLFPASIIPVKLKITPKQGQIHLQGSHALIRESDPVIIKHPGCVSRIEYFFEPGYDFGDVTVYAFGIRDDVKGVSSARGNRLVRFIRVR